ncbi:MAG: DUF3102 domain-containing protein [Magnetococcales bacterium]|nr:DUF3102 domain-containing protein [Magnetococcales bacterium]
MHNPEIERLLTENLNLQAGVAMENEPMEIAEMAIEGEVISPPTDVAVSTDPRTVDDFAAWITQSWRESMEGIMETGRRISEAKKALPHGEFLDLIEDRLPFGDDTALRLRRIAESERFSNPAPERDLPHSYTVLYELLGFRDDEFEKLTESGAINRNTTRKEIMAIKLALRNPPKKPGTSAESDESNKSGNDSLVTSTGFREINYPKTFALRLTLGEAVMLQDLFNTTYQLGMVGKWINERYSPKSKGRPDPSKLSVKFKMLELPELPIFSHDEVA